MSIHGTGGLQKTHSCIQNVAPSGSQTFLYSYSKGELMETSMHMAINSQTKPHKVTNHLLIPFIESSGEMSYKRLRNTILGTLSQSEGITTPAIIKKLKIQSHEDEEQVEYESYRERCYAILNQLQPITPDSGITVFGSDLEHTYEPLLVRGTSKNQVLFIEQSIADKVKALFTSPEELLAYGKFLLNEPAYGLHEIECNIQIEDDDSICGLYRDGIGRISSDLIHDLKVGPIVQIRAALSHLSLGSIAKGLLKVDDRLPSNTISFTQSQLKGLSSDWTGNQKIWLSILRSYTKPGKLKDSWTSLEINQEIKLNEINKAKERARYLTEIMINPIKAVDYKGLVDDNESHTLLDKVLQVAVGAKNKSLPPLAEHPFIANGIKDLMASKLRECAVDGATRWDYLVASGTLTGENEDRAIKTNLYPIGTKLVVRRYPILLADSWGIVTGKADNYQEIQIGKTIANELAADHDGDCLGIIECPLRLRATQEARAKQKQTIKKKHDRLSSTWWELPEVIVKNIGSSGIGTATYGMLASKIAGKHDLADDLSHELQAAVDSVKWSVRADIKKCRDALDQYGLPVHVAHRHDKKQFRSPETTNRMDSPLWNAVVDTYRETMKEQKVLPLRAYSMIFGHQAHGLSPDEFKHLNDIYRFYCSSVSKISKLSSDKLKQEKMKDLFDNLRMWASDKSDKWIIGAWILTHGYEGKNNRASFVFEVFRDKLINLLIRAYQSEQLSRSWPEDIDIKPINGLYGPLFRSGIPLVFEGNDVEEDSNKGLNTIAILQIKGISSEQLAEAIERKQIEIRKLESKPLPALGTFSHAVYFESKHVADIADSSIRNYLMNPKLEGEIITYQKSIKVIRAESV